MRNELKHIEEIENYLLGRLSPADKKTFESRMGENPELLAEVEIQKAITEKIKIKAFATEINNFHKEFITTESIASKTFFGKWFLNTFLAILITGTSALTIYYFAGGKEKNMKIADKKTASHKSEINQPIEEVKNIAKDTLTKRKITSTYSGATMIPSGPLYKKSGNDFTNDFNSNPQRVDESLLEKLQIPFEEITMDSQEGKEFYTKKSQSHISFPAGILQHQDGSKVEGEVTIRYREFRNPAEMAFSGIPMEHEQNREKFQMNSAGMIEIRCVQNGEELKIGKNNYFTLDYKVTDNLDSCYFWSLNDQTKKWTCQDTLRYGNPNPEISEGYPYGMVIGKLFDAYSKDSIFYSKIEFTPIGDLNPKNYTAFYNDTGFIVPNMEPGQYLATFSKKGYESFQFAGVYVTKGQMSELEIHLKPKKNGFKLRKFWYSAFGNTYNKKLKKVNAKGSFRTFNDIPENLKGEYMMTESSGEMIYEEVSDIDIRMNRNNASVTEVKRPKFVITNPRRDEIEAAKNNAVFSKTVYGLQCEGFGIYNCDQIKRMKKPVNVRPSYGNTGISENYYNTQTVIIDKNMNSVFTFYGKDFTINKDGRNCLLIHSNGKIFGIKENEFSTLKISKDGDYFIPIKDLSTEIRSTEDLKKFLEL